MLEARFPNTVETESELVAHHYTEAGGYAQAVGYWQQAGQRAMQRSANVEAVAHLSQGIELLTILPDTPARCSPRSITGSPKGSTRKIYRRQKPC
jgi:predicted ATPase